MTDLARMGIAELAPLIKSGEASPVDVVKATLARIERLNGDLNAFISLYPEMAMDEAQKAEAQINSGHYKGPLHGIPLGIKDLFEVQGMERTCGSAFLQEPPAANDATSVARLKAAGAVIVGLLNLNEFAYGPTGINPHKGSARNPWDRNSACGGSSAGAGCAVSAQLVPGAMGTDTGGSVRLPGSICGVVGLKQTYGLASRQGIYALCDSFDHGGPLARSVEDSALMLQAIAGEDVLDPTTRGSAADDYSAKLGQSIKGLRIGIPKQFFFEDIHPDVETSVREAIEVFGGLGAQISEIDMPFCRDATRAWTTMALVEAFNVHQENLENHYSDLSPIVSERLELGRDILARDYVNARNKRDQINRQVAALMEDVDIIATPTAPIPAVSIETGMIEVEGREVDGPAELGRYTRLAAFTGQPGISVPCGFTGAGLPVGLQLMGRWFEETTLLGAADAFEQATPWNNKVPPGID